jgi:hypothetical protein
MTRYVTCFLPRPDGEQPVVRAWRASGFFQQDLAGFHRWIHDGTSPHAGRTHMSCGIENQKSMARAVQFLCPVEPK